jgi:hypothetical protein
MPSSQKSLSFQVYSWSGVPSSGRAQACLVSDNWDDFGFKTLFTLIIFDDDGTKHEIGHVKIAKFGIGKGPFRTKIPQSFTNLDEKYFSLGQDDSYYEALGKLDAWIREAALSGLRDVVLDTDQWKRAREESVTITSLLRSVTPKSVEGQYRRLVQGLARLTDYDFTYTAPKRVTDWSRSSIVDTKSITLPAVARSIDVRKRPVKDSPVASGAVVDCRTLQCTR